MDGVITRKVTLEGIRDIMFDRYPGNNDTELPPEEKFYFGKDKKTLVLPALNLLSFLSAQNSMSASRMCFGKGYKVKSQALLSCVMISPDEIPITRNGKPIRFQGFDKNGIVVSKMVTRPKGVPKQKLRPIVNLPWEVSFTLELMPNDEINEHDLRRLFEKGGIMIGFGTFRGLFGKFIIKEWE